MEKKVLNLLCENARMSLEEIGRRLDLQAAEVAGIIGNLEKNGAVCGYTAILGNAALGAKVRALIEVRVTPQRDGGFDKVAKRIAKFAEVKELFLVSGAYDLLLSVEGDTLQDVAEFVSAKLSTIDGVLSTATSFQLKKYKESGRIMENEESYQRLKVCP